MYVCMYGIVKVYGRCRSAGVVYVYVCMYDIVKSTAVQVSGGTRVVFYVCLVFGVW